MLFSVFRGTTTRWADEATSPTLRPALCPERAADHDADRTEEACGQGQEEAEPVNAKGADGVADGVAKEGVLVLGRLTVSPLPGVGGREDERAM